MLAKVVVNGDFFSGVDFTPGGLAMGAAEPWSGTADDAMSGFVSFDRAATSAVYDLFHGQWKLDRDGVRARFPFGWGLGYGEARLDGAEVLGPHTVRVTASNDGESPTSTVVFAFGGLDASAHERPHRRLIGFARRVVDGGADQSFDIDLDWSALDVRLDGSWVVEPGRYVVEVGLHAHDPNAIVLHVDRG